MIKAGQIAKGMFLLYKDEPHLVAEREFVSPGKGSAFVRLKLKNVKTGLVLRETIKSQEQVEEAVVEDQDAQFLYRDADNYHFMHGETYEQLAVPVEGLEDKALYLKEGETYQLVMWERTPIDIKLPYKMPFVVTEAEHAIKGDTVSGSTKQVTIETGAVVKVPLFIKKGDRIVVNTETGEYVERAT